MRRADGLPKEFRLHRSKSARPKNKPSLSTSSGIMVRSQFEKKAISFFEENNIKFRYEPLMLLDGKQYRPDFYLTELNLFVELCGMNHMVYYKNRQEFKKQIYQKNNLKAIFINCSNISEVIPRLKEALKDFL